MTRQQLIEERNNLQKRLNEVQKQLDKIDIEVYGGKIIKAIELLGECLDYLNYPTIPFECPDCARLNEINLAEIIDGLQTLYKREF